MTSSNRRGSLADIGKLVEQHNEAQVEAAKAKLTTDNGVKFKMVLGHQIEEEYNFQSLRDLTDPDLGRKLNDDERLKIYDLLGDCIDKYVGRSITAVSANFRRDDTADEAYDPVGGDMMQVKHFGLHHAEKPRIHGYFNSQGYFVITRLDWLHLRHLRVERAAS